MGFFDRLSNGWQLGKQSLAVIWNDKSLALFPLISGIASVGIIAAFYLGIGPDNIQGWIETQDKTGEIPWLGALLALILYFALSFVTIYFNAALIGAAALSLDGKDTTLGDGFKAANAHLLSILAWSVVSGTVGLLLSVIESNEKGGRILRSIIGTAWSALTYFVMPVMIFERKNVFSSVGSSINLMKQSWGENVSAQFSIWLYTLLLSLPVFLIFIYYANIESTRTIHIIIFGTVYILALTLLNQIAKSVLTVVLYRFAMAKQSVPGFDTKNLDNAFR
ncbi:DUF6159 family protein [Amphritea japonica]|uniref:Uncharacterized protein n=1 Tax=Amphritea japonica ATCC BAA-1530 TaxID=1278309 RepID=A0A7R6PN23_9GAMM|nr:DUF6159 family protein [Amphritea japonica]BBB27320.1 conserved hypothetical protein [Amphritea japonica ATCC BAA-1530]